MNNQWGDFLNPWGIVGIAPFEIKIEVKNEQGTNIPVDSEEFKSAVKEQSDFLLSAVKNLEQEILEAKHKIEQTMPTEIVDTISFDFAIDPLNKDNSQKVYLPLIRK